jgi:hypothetical protein
MAPKHVRAIMGHCRRGGKGSAILLGLAAALGPCALDAEEVRYEVLHHFVPYPEGARPSSLLEGSDGKLYGTTLGGGAGHEGAHALAVNDEGEVVVAGFTTFLGFPTTLGALHESYQRAAAGRSPDEIEVALPSRFTGRTEAPRCQERPVMRRARRSGR